MSIGSRDWQWATCLGMLLSFCGQAESSSAASNSLALMPPREFKVKGIVRGLDAGERSVTITHEAIPDFMAAMTMPFHVKSTNELAALKEGDTVSFRLLVTQDESWIDGISRIKSGADEVAKATGATRASATDPQEPKKHHPLLDYAFTNELGQPVRLGEFRGQALAITFFFTRCPLPDYCPRLSKNFEEASRKLLAMHGAPTNWHFLSVSFDTRFDTPERLRAYGEAYGYESRHWSFLTGPADKIAELARLSGMTYEEKDGFFAHNLRTLIIDPNGTLKMVFPVGGNLSDAIVGEILKATAATNPAVERSLAGK